jgi:hypothetical protein
VLETSTSPSPVSGCAANGSSPSTLPGGGALSPPQLVSTTNAIARTLLLMRGTLAESIRNGKWNFLLPD